MILNLILLLMAALLPSNFPASPAVNTQLRADHVLTVHADGSVSMVGVVASEQVLICSVCDATTDIQDPVNSCLSTTWRSVDNTSHTVVTPIVSVTPAGLERAIALHTELVRQMKIIYKPLPDPVPPKP